MRGTEQEIGAWAWWRLAAPANATGIMMLRLRIVDCQPLRLFLQNGEEILDNCAISQTRSLVLTTKALHVLDHSGRFPKMIQTLHQSSLDLSEETLFAGILQSFECEEARFVEAVASSIDASRGVLINIVIEDEGSLKVRSRQPYRESTRNSIRIADKVSVVQNKETGEIVVLDGSEHFLFVAPDDRLSRRSVCPGRGRDALFIASNRRIYKYALRQLRLEFVIEFSERVECISPFLDGYLFVLGANGSFSVASVHTGYIVLEHRISIEENERVKSCSAHSNGAIVTTNRRIFHVLIGRSQDDLSFYIPFCDRIYFRRSVGPKLLDSVPMPKEYLTERLKPIRLASLRGSRLAVAGQHGLGITRVSVGGQNNPRSSWTIVHPDTHELKVVMNCVDYIDEDFLVAACTMENQSNGRMRHELQIYSISTQPITIVDRITLSSAAKLLHISTDQKVCLVDDSGRLLLFECGVNGWSEIARAELQEARDIRKIVYSSPAFYLLKSNTLYSVKYRAISDNPINCTIASVFEGGGGERIEDFYVLEGSIVAILLFREKEWKIVVKLHDSQLCSVPLLEQSSVIHASLLALDFANGNVIHVLPHVLVAYLANPERHESLYHPLVESVSSQLDLCMFTLWTEKLLPAFLQFVCNAGLSISQVYMSAARVARTLEYDKALEFMSSAGLSVSTLLDYFIQHEMTEGLTCIFRLCVDNERGNHEVCRSVSKVFLSQFKYGELREVLDLASKLGISTEDSRQQVIEQARKAYSAVNLPDLRVLCEIVPDAIAHCAAAELGGCGGIELPTKEEGDRLAAAAAASLIVDPSAAEWVESKSGMERTAALLQPLLDRRR